MSRGRDSEIAAGFKAAQKTSLQKGTSSNGGRQCECDGGE
jgi:hypothetical protein